MLLRRSEGRVAEKGVVVEGNEEMRGREGHGSNHFGIRQMPLFCLRFLCKLTAAAGVIRIVFVVETLTLILAGWEYDLVACLYMYSSK